MIGCITINTDASHCPYTKAGGYAFYIICDRFKIQKSGYFKAYPKGATDAEMMCFANALHTLLEQPELPKTKRIVINSDSMQVIGLVIKKRNCHSEHKAYELLNKLKKRAGNPKVDFRHVKAHSGKEDARSYINRWCDRESRKNMKIRRKQIQTKTA